MAKYQIGLHRNLRAKHDGHRTTTYRKKSVEYHKLYTKYTIDIRPAVCDYLVLEFNDNRVLKIIPSQSSRADCKYVKFENVTYAATSYPIVNHRHHGKPWAVRFQQAIDACEHENKIHGQCNAFSMVQYWAPITIPYPFITVIPPGDNEHPGKYDTYIRSCPHTDGVSSFFI